MADSAPRPQPRVLIVDDEEATRLLFARMVSRELDAEVQLAGTSEQALRLARAQAYDAILLDLMMPGIGGLGVLKEIRRDSPNRDTPVIVVSVMPAGEMRDECIAAGADEYLEKPVTRERLAGALESRVQPDFRRAPK
jgi:CheY-like chemotaxis protein